METNQFLRDEYLTLRDEIKATKARLFWIVTIGLVGVPLVTHFGAQADFFARLLVPFSVLMLIVTFLAEQSSMMRAGRYIREQIEKNVNFSPGWEAWIEVSPQYRLADRHFVACFLIVFFLYYFTTIGMAIESILREEAKDMTGKGLYWYWFYGVLVAYAVGGFWAFSTLIHHWKSTVSTSAKAETLKRDGVST